MIHDMTMMTPQTAETLHEALEWLILVLLAGILPVLLARRHPARRGRLVPAHQPRHGQDHAKTQEALLHEVNHRVKNNFGSIIGLLQMKRDFARSSQEETHLLEMESQLTGLARIHDLLSESGWRPIMLEDLCRSVVRAGTALSSLPCRYEVTASSPGLRVSHTQAQPLTLVLSELVSNAIKHGATTPPSLMITMTLSERDGFILLDFTDNGPGYPPSLLDRSRWGEIKGLRIVQDLVASGLKGSVALSNTSGALARITFPKHP